MIPDLLPKEEPYLNWDDPEHCLLFRYDYDVLPGSVISRFIVRMHTYTAQNTCWRTGVVLSYQENQALVKADLEESLVEISVIGEERTRREFLAIIRSNFDHIHRTIPRIEARASVPIREHPSVVVDYQHLLNLEQLGQEEFVPPGLREMVSVKQLLDGVDAGRVTEPPATISIPTDIPRSQLLSGLRATINNLFNEEELRTLTFDMGIDYDSLPARGKAGRARELIAYMERRDRLSELVEYIERERPDINLDDILQ